MFSTISTGSGAAKLPDAPSALPEVLGLETEQRIAYAERVLALLMHVIYAQEKSVNFREPSSRSSVTTNAHSTNVLFARRIFLAETCEE